MSKTVHFIRPIAVFAAVLMLAACQAIHSMNEPVKVEAFAERYTAAWNSGDPAQVASFYSEDGVLTINEGEPSVGRADIEAVAKSFMEAFPDLLLTLERVGREGGRVTYHWTFSGTYSENGAKVLFSGYEAWRFGKDGLIADSIGTFNAEDYERQLNAPAESQR